MGREKCGPGLPTCPTLAADLEDEHHLRVEFNGDHEQQSELLAALIQANVRVVQFHEEHANLEDVFMRLTTGAVQ